MSGPDGNPSPERDVAESEPSMTSRKKYVAPALSRYGSLAELTKNSGVKYGNDGQGMGCGEQKDTSCPR